MDHMATGANDLCTFGFPKTTTYGTNNLVLDPHGDAWPQQALVEIDCVFLH